MDLYQESGSNSKATNRVPNTKDMQHILLKVSQKKLHTFSS